MVIIGIGRNSESYSEGGTVVASLLRVPNSFENSLGEYFHRVAYTQSDIDIYFYGLDEKQFTQKALRLLRHLQKVNGEVLVVK